MYETDFIGDEPIEFKIDGRPFKYKPVTAGQENDWLNEYIKMTDKGVVQDFTKLNKLKIRNIIAVPYSPELIQKQLKLERPQEWSTLTDDQKWDLIGKLSPKLFNQIISEINKIDAPNKKKT